ncbi:MAG: DUF1854 domain-containing protein [Planctomycetota bacterium]|jgi:hypothetical protein|nr:DUF1854 domain-containing protein [Planctomycetota bacterium]
MMHNQSKHTLQFLDPETTRIYRGNSGLLHVRLIDKPESEHQGVHAVLAFPISHPDSFISLRCEEDRGEHEYEVGVIEALSQFNVDSQSLIRQSLGRHYFERVILQIRRIRKIYGVLEFEVDTASGPQTLMMKWSYNSTEDYGKTGKVLLDIHDNRWIIPNIDALPEAAHEQFRRWIYW